VTKQEKNQLRVALQDVQKLERRVSQLEEEMALCLRWMRVHAELEAKKRDPLFVPGRSTKPIPS
jgi:hypothetical protein